VIASLDNSTKTISFTSTDLLRAIKEKRDKPTLENRATIWYEKASRIHELSDSLYHYLMSLEKTGSTRETEINELANRLIDYKNAVAVVDKRIQEILSSLPLFKAELLDKNGRENPASNRNLMKASDKNAQSLLLAKFRNDTRVTENQLINYCFHQIQPYDEGYYTSYSAIVAQSNSIAEAGEMIEITAGLGSFSKAAKPEIFINGNSVPLNDEGYARYKTSAPILPGKHKIPVLIKFFDQDGKENTIERTVSYTVRKKSE
jgi:hypothetical protein